MYLLDTNVWLERLLDQGRSEEVGGFPRKISSDQLFMTDFSFHSIGIAMQKLDRVDEFLGFIDDVFIDGAVTLLGLNPEESKEIAGAITEFKLDFDDAYQYVAAAKHGLVLVSFDADFDRTARKRKTPVQVTE